MPARGRSSFEVVIVAGAFAAISVSAAITQPMERLYADAQIYQSVAVQFYESRVPINAPVPGGTRVVTPWLAAKLRPVVSRAMPRLDSRVEKASGMLGVAPFLLINIAASAAATLLLLFYLRRFIDSAVVRVMLVIAWASMWHSPVRRAYFYPANIDALSMTSLIGGLLIIEVWRDRSPMVAALLLAPVVFVGTLIKETMVLVAIAFGIAQVMAATRGHSGTRGQVPRHRQLLQQSLVVLRQPSGARRYAGIRPGADACDRSRYQSWLRGASRAHLTVVFSLKREDYRRPPPRTAARARQR